MSLFTPKWKSENKEKAVKSVQKIVSNEKLLEAALQAPLYDVKAEAVKRITDDQILLRIIRAGLNEFSSLGSPKYNLDRLKQLAFERMSDEQMITEAALYRKPDNDSYIDKISDEKLLFRLARKYYLPSAFRKISDNRRQIELAMHNNAYVEYVRLKRDEDWVRLGLKGFFPDKKTVFYAKQIILDGNEKGFVILKQYIQKHPQDFPTDKLKELDELGKKYTGKELWVQIGLLGFFPLEKTAEYCREILDGDDLRGVDILLNAAKKHQKNISVVSNIIDPIIELYRKAKNEHNAGMLKRLQTIPEGEYGNHVDGDFHYCDYVDHEDKGVVRHFDVSEL